MNLRSPFDNEIRIRLTDSLSGFVCSIQRGWLYKTSDEFTIEPSPVASLEPIDRVSDLVPVRDRPRLRNL